MKKWLRCTIKVDFDQQVNLTDEEYRALENYLDNEGNTVPMHVNTGDGLRENPIYDLIMNKLDLNEWCDNDDIEDAELYDD